MADVGGEVADLIRRLHSRAPRWRLFCVTANGSLKPVDNYDTPADPADLIDAIEKRAQRYANTHTGTQLFELQAVESEAEKIIATENWRCSGELLPGGFPIHTEPANEAGLVSMSMRQAEAFFRMSIGERKAAADSSERLIRRLSTDLANAQALNLKSMKVIEQAYSQDHMRRLESTKAAADMQLKADLGEKIGSMIPMVGHMMMKKLKPEGAALSAAHVARSLFESMNESQYEAIMAALSPEQRAQMMTLFKELLDEDDKKKAARAAAAAKTTVVEGEIDESAKH